MDVCRNCKIMSCGITAALNMALLSLAERHKKNQKQLFYDVSLRKHNHCLLSDGLFDEKMCNSTAWLGHILIYFETGWHFIKIINKVFKIQILSSFSQNKRELDQVSSSSNISLLKLNRRPAFSQVCLLACVCAVCLYATCTFYHPSIQTIFSNVTENGI